MYSKEISLFTNVFKNRDISNFYRDLSNLWSILLIKSDLKWCIHLSRSLFSYFNYLVSVTAGGPTYGEMRPAIEICMHDVTDFRRPYTVLESTTAESKTSLFPILYMGSFFPGIEILTLHRLEFSSPLLAK